jgi:competence protein ComEC
MMSAMKLLATLLIGTALLSAQSKNLEIYWIDVEGGGATLIVAPGGESLLVDTGNPAPDDRDAKRIFAAAKKAGLTKIDYLLTTHFHADHVGGVAALAKMIPISHFLDHGDSIEQTGFGAGLWTAYTTTAAGKRITLKPGDKLPVKGLDAVVVSSNGATLAAPIARATANPFCALTETKPPDTTENQRSLGFLLTFGKFRFLDVGDLTWDKEVELSCPINKLGEVSLMQATHHGFFRDFSGAPAQVWGVKPQVMVVNNGAHKGWQSSAWDTTAQVAGIEGVWQLHRAVDSDAAHNTTADMIANDAETKDCTGNWIQASIARDGKFTITNGRNGYSRTYSAR